MNFDLYAREMALKEGPEHLYDIKESEIISRLKSSAKQQSMKFDERRKKCL